MARKLFGRTEKEEAPEAEVEVPFEHFITVDHKLVEKLQDKFGIKSITYDRVTETRTFTFYVSRQEVEKYLGGK